MITNYDSDFFPSTTIHSLFHGINTHTHTHTHTHKYPLLHHSNIQSYLFFILYIFSPNYLIKQQKQQQSIYKPLKTFFNIFSVTRKFYFIFYIYCLTSPHLSLTLSFTLQGLLSLKFYGKCIIVNEFKSNGGWEHKIHGDFTE